MNKFLEKLKNINYKSKKAIICYIVAGAILISGTGTGIALYVNNNTNSDSIIEQSNTKGKKENDKKDTSTKPNEDKKEDKSHKVEKDKDNKKEDSKNSDKNKTDDKKSTSNKTDNNKNIVTTNTNNKKPTSNNTIYNSNNNKPTFPSKPNKPTPPAHTHNWQPQYQTIHHKEQGHNEQVLVKPAWTEEVPKYEYKWIHICNICGKDITGFASKHNQEHMINNEVGPNGEGGWRPEQIQVQVGVDKINHPAEYTNKWVVDKQDWTENKLIGYICSCGAKK